MLKKMETVKLVLIAMIIVGTGGPGGESEGGVFQLPVPTSFLYRAATSYQLPATSSYKPFFIEHIHCFLILLFF